MSYPSIHRHIELQGVTLANANDQQLSNAFLAAFHEDLPLGMARIEELVAKIEQNDGKAMLSLDPNSEEGKQFARLLGPDIPRQVLSDHYGKAFGFYNCCIGTGGKDKKDLQLSMREQIESQHPDFVDC